MEVAWHRPRRAHDDVALAGRRVDGAEDLALRRQRRTRERVEALDLAVPIVVEAGNLIAVQAVDRPSVQRLGEQLDCRPRVADEREARLLRGVEVGDVDVHVRDVGVAEAGLRLRREVRPARPDADHDVRVGCDPIRRERSGDAERAERRRVVVAKRAFAGLRLAHGDPRRAAQEAKRVGRLRIDDASPCDDERPARAANERRRLRDGARVRHGPRDVPDTLLEQLRAEVVCLRLNVLRERERDGAGLGLVDEDSHRLRRGGHDLLGAPDPVEVAGNGAEAIVHGDVSRPRNLELLEHGLGPARREDVAGNEQDGDTVDRRERGTGDHVRRSGPDRGRAYERAEPVLHPSVCRSRVHHRLLVPRLVVGQQLGRLVQRFADARDVAVAEDAEASAEEALLHPVALDVLRSEEAEQRLCRGQTNRSGHGADCRTSVEVLLQPGSNSSSKPTHA